MSQRFDDDSQGPFPGGPFFISYLCNDRDVLLNVDPTAVRVAMDPGAHQFPAMLVDAPALPPALIALHLPVVAVLVAAGNVHPCKDARKPSRKIFITSHVPRILRRLPHEPACRQPFIEPVTTHSAQEEAESWLPRKRLCVPAPLGAIPLATCKKMFLAACKNVVTAWATALRRFRLPRDGLVKTRC